MSAIFETIILAKIVSALIEGVDSVSEFNSEILNKDGTLFSRIHSFLNQNAANCSVGCRGHLSLIILF